MPKPINQPSADGMAQLCDVGGKVTLFRHMISGIFNKKRLEFLGKGYCNTYKYAKRKHVYI